MVLLDFEDIFSDTLRPTMPGNVVSDNEFLKDERIRVGLVLRVRLELRLS